MSVHPTDSNKFRNHVVPFIGDADKPGEGFVVGRTTRRPDSNGVMAKFGTPAWLTRQDMGASSDAKVTQSLNSGWTLRSDWKVEGGKLPQAALDSLSAEVAYSDNPAFLGWRLATEGEVLANAGKSEQSSEVRDILREFREERGFGTFRAGGGTGVSAAAAQAAVSAKITELEAEVKSLNSENAKLFVVLNGYREAAKVAAAAEERKQLIDSIKEEMAAASAAASAAQVEEIAALKAALAAKTEAPPLNEVIAEAVAAALKAASAKGAKTGT